MDDATGSGELAVIIAFLGAYLLFLAAIYVFLGFCMGKVLQKAGKPLWSGFVPIYNVLLLLEITGRPTWWIVLYLIPPVNVVISIITCIDVAKSFGKDVVWGLLLAFVGIIGWPMLAFGDATYQGPSASPR